MEIFTNLDSNETTEVLINQFDYILRTEMTKEEFCDFTGLDSDLINEDETQAAWERICLEEINSVIFQQTGDYYFYFKN